MKKMILLYLTVGCAGFLGSITRLFIGRIFVKSTFPIGTLLINITGCFLLGWFMTWAGSRSTGIPETLRIGVAIGFVGAYTTFSTYMFESNRMFEDGAWVRAMVYIVGSVILGFLAVRLGVILGHRMST